MTTVQEPPTRCPDADAGGFLRVDLLLAQIAVEDAAHEDLSGCTETQLVDKVRQIESLQASLTALQATRVRAFARAHVENRLAAHRDLARLGIGRLRAMTRRLVAELVPDRFRARVHAARAERRVTLRPAPDAMSYLTAYVPVEQGAACLAARQRTFTELSVSQGIVIGGDSRKRTFTGLLATLVRARAGHRCTEPYCDAPVRHLDHIERAADGGPTTSENGRGVCQFHNHVREQPGWHVARAPDGTVATTTPTGHTYYGPGPRHRPDTADHRRGR